MRAEATNADIAAAGGIKFLQLGGERLAVCKFQQMQIFRIANGDHRAKRRLDPISTQQAVTP